MKWIIIEKKEADSPFYSFLEWKDFFSLTLLSEMKAWAAIIKGLNLHFPAIQRNESSYCYDHYHYKVLCL